MRGGGRHLFRLPTHSTAGSRSGGGWNVFVSRSDVPVFDTRTPNPFRSESQYSTWPSWVSLRPSIVYAVRFTCGMTILASETRNPRAHTEGTNGAPENHVKRRDRGEHPGNSRRARRARRLTVGFFAYRGVAVRPPESPPLLGDDEPPDEPPEELLPEEDEPELTGIAVEPLAPPST